MSGVGATLLGFALTIVWDIWKLRNERIGREQAVLNAASEELRANKSIVEENLMLLRQELQVLTQNQSMLKPLLLLKTGFWHLAKINPPRPLFQGDKLIKLRELAATADGINENIRSREAYRIQNQAMDNYTRRMQKLNQILIDEFVKLHDAMSEFSI